jgi:hypothetical protein
MKMGAAKKQWLTCSRCNTKVFDTVITKHMWKSHRKHMMKNRGGRKAQDKPVIPGKPVDQGLHAAKKYLSYSKIAEIAASGKPKKKLPKPHSMLEAHRGQKVDGRTVWGRTVNAERKREASQAIPTLRATHLAPEGKTLTITVHQGKNYVEISNVTLVEVCE